MGCHGNSIQLSRRNNLIYYRGCDIAGAVCAAQYQSGSVQYRAIETYNAVLSSYINVRLEDFISSLSRRTDWPVPFPAGLAWKLNRAEVH